MAVALVSFPPFISIPSHTNAPSASLQSQFIPRNSPTLRVSSSASTKKKAHHVLITCSSSAYKLVRDPRLDKHIVKQNKIRFVQKLKTLLLLTPKHFMHVQNVYKFRSFLSLPDPRSVLTTIRRYPTIFEIFTITTPPNPLLTTATLSRKCVRLTPAAAALAKKESDLKKHMAESLAEKIQKLLMLASPYHRLLLSKLVHLGPDIGLPVNFRSRLCNDHPDKFKVVETSYGRALELVEWDSDLAKVMPPLRDEKNPRGLIVDRPLKFKQLTLRKGLNVKRHHHDYLIKFGEVGDLCPYGTDVVGLANESIEAEKRACAVVREVLGMTVEKRTLVDHLMHFRKEFRLPTKLRGMLVRHPEMFYVSLRGQRDSVFLVEGYSDSGELSEKDEILVIRDELMKLVSEGKRMGRERRRKGYTCDDDAMKKDGRTFDDNADDECCDDEFGDGLDDLFQLEDCSSEDDVDGGDDDEDSRELTVESGVLDDRVDSVVKR